VTNLCESDLCTKSPSTCTHKISMRIDIIKIKTRWNRGTTDSDSDIKLRSHLTRNTSAGRIDIAISSGRFEQLVCASPWLGSTGSFGGAAAISSWYRQRQTFSPSLHCINRMQNNGWTFNMLSCRIFLQLNLF